MTKLLPRIQVYADEITVLKARVAILLAGTRQWASECAECHGTGLSDDTHQDCDACADIRSLFSPPAPRPRELVFVPYSDADKMLLSGSGWRLAPEEDFNDVLGHVYLERNLPTVSQATAS